MRCLAVRLGHCEGGETLEQNDDGRNSQERILGKDSKLVDNFASRNEGLAFSLFLDEAEVANGGSALETNVGVRIMLHPDPAALRALDYRKQTRPSPPFREGNLPLPRELPDFGHP